MKMVILDGYALNPGDLGWEELELLGELTVYDRTPYDNNIIAQRISDAEVIFTNKTVIDRDLLDRCPTVKYIGVLATGFNIVDIEAAAEHGIIVTNVPGYGTAAVAQFAFSLLLEICCRAGHYDHEVHEGKWSASPDYCFWDTPLIELAGKTAGIIGFGKIGKAVGEIARGFNMNVLACGSRPTEEGMRIAEYTDQDFLLENSDVIFLNCPLMPETEGLINTGTIEKMKDGVIIINNSRGQLVVEEDLAEALNSGKVFAAGVDVASEEPIKESNPLLSAKNCFITPHISWAASDSRKRLLDTAVGNLKCFLSGNPVNVIIKKKG